MVEMWCRNQPEFFSWELDSHMLAHSEVITEFSFSQSMQRTERKNEAQDVPSDILFMKKC